VNKAQLIEALAERLGDKKTASQAVEGVVDLIVRNVNKGEKVNITGFGVFEKRARAARTARNPRTGEAVKVKKTNVPAFRAGTQFKEVVGGTRKLPRATAAKSGAAKAATRGVAKTSTTRAGKSATTTRTAATRATATRSTAKTGTRAATAKTTASKAAAKTARPSTKKATTRRSTKK
jgi:DNA-binding protein HU-beta